MAVRYARMLGTGAIAALALTTACEPGEPPPPPPQFAVTTTADVADVAPGDGVCEATAGAGDCSLRAAVEEGNALGRADITLPDATHPLDTDLEVTGDLRIGGTRPGTASLGVTDAGIHVAAGASLVVAGVDLDLAHVVVDGAFAFLRGSLVSFGSSLVVHAGGTALVQNAWVASADTSAVANAGTLVLDHVTVGGTMLVPRPWGTGGIDLGGLATAPGATTHLRATWFASLSCTGEAPVSMGHNADSSTACGLTGPGDLSNVPGWENEAGWVEGPTDPLVDAVPVGVAGCGTSLTTDMAGAPRPADGDGDGTAACDIGAVERPAA